MNASQQSTSERARFWAELRQFDGATRHSTIFSGDNLWQKTLEMLTAHDRATDTFYRERLTMQPADLRARTEFDYHTVMLHQMEEYQHELSKLERRSRADRARSREYEQAVRMALFRRVQMVARHELTVMERKRGTVHFDHGTWQHIWGELCKAEGLIANAVAPESRPALYNDWRHWHEQLLLRVEERTGRRADRRTAQQMNAIRQQIADLSPAPRLKPALITATISLALMVGLVIILFIQVLPVLGQERTVEAAQRRPAASPTAGPRGTATPTPTSVLSGTARRVTPTPTSGLSGVAQPIPPTATPVLTGKAAPRARVPSPTPLSGKAAPVR